MTAVCMHVSLQWWSINPLPKGGSGYHRNVCIFLAYIYKDITRNGFTSVHSPLGLVDGLLSYILGDISAYCVLLF